MFVFQNYPEAMVTNSGSVGSRASMNYLKKKLALAPAS